MKVKQFVNATCYIESGISVTEKKDRSIFLVLPNLSKDQEKVEAVSKVTDKLALRGWIVGCTQTLEDALALEFTQNCDSQTLIENMLACQ